MNKPTIRRINLYGGPGTGKSTTTALMFARLKQFTVSEGFELHVEHIQEYVKSWAYEQRKIRDWQQVYIFGKQLNRENIPLSNGVDVIVSDSPLVLGCAFAKKYSTPGYQNLIALAKEFDHYYPSLNIFLRRGNRKYVRSGRYEDEEKARQMDVEIENMLKDYGAPYFNLPVEQPDLIFSVIVRELGLDAHIVPKTQNEMDKKATSYGNV